MLFSVNAPQWVCKNCSCSPHHPAPSSGSPQHTAGSPLELHGRTRSPAPRYRRVMREENFCHLLLYNYQHMCSTQITTLQSPMRISKQICILNIHAQCEQGCLTVVWRPVSEGCSAGLAAHPPHPAAAWLHGCHSALAGSSGCWWYSIAQLWG